MLKPEGNGIMLEWPRDNKRYNYFVRESTEHQAKMELRTYKWAVENYTAPGDLILDPMSGVGTVHFANFIGRDTVAVEIVPRFAELQEENIKHMTDIYEKGEFYAEDMGNWDHIPSSPAKNQILVGDCRRHLPLADRLADACIFSPPYGGLWAYNAKSRGSKVMEEKNYKVGYDDNIANVGNLANYTAYLAAMKIIYTRCFESMRVGAPLVTVVKDYIQNGRRVPCSRDNLRLCIESGFMPEAWHFRDASQQNNPFSAGNRKKRIAAGKHKPELDILAEDVIVVRKR